jgi:hypothetical protein
MENVDWALFGTTKGAGERFRGSVVSEVEPMVKAIGLHRARI